MHARVKLAGLLVSTLVGAGYDSRWEKHMKRRVVLALSLLILGALVSLAIQARTLDEVLESGKLRVAVSLFTPWTLKGKDGELQGFEIEVTKRLANDMGVKPEFEVFQWDDVLPALEQGKVDIVVAGMAITPQRALRVNFSQPYASSGIDLATHTERTSHITKLEELNTKDIVVASVAGTLSAKLTKELFENAKLKSFATSDEAKQALVEGKVHAYVAASPLPRFVALEHPDTVDVPLSKPLLVYKAGFAVRKGDPDFVNFLNSWIIAREADTWLPTTHKYWFESLRWRRDLSK